MKEEEGDGTAIIFLQNITEIIRVKKAFYNQTMAL